MKHVSLAIGFLSLASILLSGPVTTQYFPELAFENSKELNNFVVEWYTKNLLALQEPSLFETSKDKRIHCYRFLWLRTFDEPIAVRLIVDPEGTGLIVLKIASGASGYDPGILTTNETVPLMRSEVDNFLEQMNRAKFWQQPTREKTDAIGLDGAQWIFEGVKFGNYHIVDRWSPKMGAYRETALLLLRLSKIKVKAIY